MSIVLTDQQQAAVDMVQHSRMSILVGGPGTGKTTTVNQIVAQAKKQRKTVFMAAPTGKAAKRMTEATGEPASTIHSLLGWEADGENYYRFAFNSDNPLPCDLLILDEVSMIDRKNPAAAGGRPGSAAVRGTGGCITGFTGIREYPACGT